MMTNLNPDKMSINSAVSKTVKTLRLHIDPANMYKDTVGDEGISLSEIAHIDGDLRRAHQELTQKSESGLDAEYAALNLPYYMSEYLPAIKQMAEAIRNYRDVILIGIGGSSLGAKAVWHALRADLPQSINALHFVENVDPYDLHHLLSHLSPDSTAVICISKSGGTIETVVQYLILRDWLVAKLGKSEAAKRQWIITDPQEGWLHDIAQRDGMPQLPVPPKVGGRYSVLSAVGLLPLAVIGVDIDALLRGAGENAARCTSEEVDKNFALELAALYFLLDTQKHKRISVMMPYVNRLRLFVDWYCQLWAESLGKKAVNSHQAPAGSLPVRAMGATDQHSQLQMYLESRNDKMFTFIELTHWEHDMPIPLDGFDRGVFPHFHGKSLADVIHAEFRATRRIITDACHPNATIRIPALNANVLGQLIDLYERITIYTALLYGVNPLDQPSVEKGKKLAVQYLRK